METKFKYFEYTKSMSQDKNADETEQRRGGQRKNQNFLKKTTNPRTLNVQIS